MPLISVSFLDVYGPMTDCGQSSWSKGISETNLKLQNTCSKGMQQPCDITGQKITIGEKQNKQK